MTRPSDRPRCRHDFRIRFTANRRYAIMSCDLCHATAVLVACPTRTWWHRLHPGPNSTPSTMLGTGHAAGTWLLP